MRELVIYGLNTYVASDVNSEVDISSLTGATLYTAKFMSGNPDDIFEGDIKPGVGGCLTGNQHQRKTYDIRLFPYKFPTQMTDYDALMTVLNKRYRYFHSLSSYEYAMQTVSTKAIDVEIMGRGNNRKVPNKFIDLQIAKRYYNPR